MYATMAVSLTLSGGRGFPFTAFETLVDSIGQSHLSASSFLIPWIEGGDSDE
jgi:hypothetical protein